MSSSNVFNVCELGDITNGKEYGLKLNLPMNVGWIYDVEFIVDDGRSRRSYPLTHYKNEEGIAHFVGKADLETKALYRYYFKYKVNGETRYVKKSGSFTDSYINQDEMNKLSVNYKTPEWTKGKTMYHIFVDRFNKGRPEDLKPMPRRRIHKNWDEDVIVTPDEDGIWNNDFYGGDLQGIIQKLAYIKSLGTDIIYLSPIVYSQSTHRYDTSDYEQIDPYVGTHEDLKELCQKCHELGIKVILDGVFNHTGNDSKYFNQYKNEEWIKESKDKGAYNNPNSKYSNMYRKYYNPNTNRMEFCYWFGFETLPVCNGSSKQWQEYITGENGIIDQWFKCGIDGLRLDVADELTDEFIGLIRKAVDRNKEDGFILGEVWKNPMYTNRGYIQDGDKMSAVMGYNFTSSMIRYIRDGNTEDLRNKINEIKTSYPTDAIFSQMNFTSTHDTTRAINLWDQSIFKYDPERASKLIDEDHERCAQYKLSKEEYERAKEIYKAYVFALEFMPGTLSIFYGDEAGVEGIGNLNNRQPFPWGKEDQELLNYFRYLGRIRHEQPFLATAGIEIIDLNDSILMFERTKEEENMLIALNRTDEEKEILLPTDYIDKPKVYTLKRNQKDNISPYGGFAIKK